MAKVALLIGVSKYGALDPLPAAERDVEALQRVLQDPSLGGFEVKPLIDPTRGAMEKEIETLFMGRGRDDLVLLYFSGHGLKDLWGRLYFATPHTEKNEQGELLRSSAVATQFVKESLGGSRARRQVIILDCCFSAAFESNFRLKDGGAVDLEEQLGGEGRVVLASSSATQYSLERPGTDLSLYTQYLVEGIETGAGDRNEDGQISVYELHQYAAERVRETAPSMTPKMILLKDLGLEIILSKAKVTDPRLQYRRTVSRHGVGDTIRPAGRAVLDILREQLGLTRAEAEAIEAEVFRPFQEYRANLARYQAALEAEAEHHYPLDAQARDALGELQKLLGLRDEDIASIEQQLSPPPTLTAEEFFYRALKKKNSGDNEGAIADYDQAIRLKPDDAAAYMNRGLAKYDLGHKEWAIADYNHVIRLKPDDAAAYMNRGLAKYDLGDKEWAIADYNQVIRLKPDDANAYYNRGLAKSALGDKEGAIADYNEAIRLKSDYAAAYYNRGNAKSDLGNNEGAIDDYNEAIRLKPTYIEAHFNCARTKWSQRLSQ